MHLFLRDRSRRENPYMGFIFISYKINYCTNVDARKGV